VPIDRSRVRLHPFEISLQNDNSRQPGAVQVNGVVRSIEVLVREAPALGVEIEILAADGFRTIALPTYPQAACCCNAA
jgi:hypothetical protein